MRFIPPHLMALVTLLIIVVWVMLVHQFRRSAALQRFVADTMGDDTPQNALVAYEAARSRLANHLNKSDLDGRTRQRIEMALGIPQQAAVIDSQMDDRLS